MRPIERTKRRASWIWIAVLFLALIFEVPDAHGQEATPPYPASPHFDRVDFEFSARDRRAPGSDNWPMTWADDGHQYTTWGDGGGFGGTNEAGRVSLGVARIEGDGADYTGHNVWGGLNAEAAAEFDGKSYGIICVGGILYLWVSPGSGNTNYDEARIAKSTDHGRHWQLADWAFTRGDGFMTPTFCQFGRNNADARDDYVYSYATRLQDADDKMQVPGMIDLIRVPKDRIMQRDAYEFFAGRSPQGSPTWTPDLHARRPVFEDPNGTRRTSVVYQPGLRRFFLCTPHGQPDSGNLGIFDAPEPWGPWTTIAYYENWGGFGSIFFWTFAPKWFSEDGLAFTFVFTGTGHNDAWNTVPGRFTLR